VDKQVVRYCDNLNSIQLARNPMFHAQTKHIKVHYHFIREKVLAGEIDFIYVNTDDVLLSPGVNPLEGFTLSSCGKLGLRARSRLPTLERGKGSCWEPRD
jgi:hypothetical protein